MKKRTTHRFNLDLHNLIKSKSHNIDWSYNRYLTNMVATYFREGFDIDLEKRIAQQHRQENIF